MSGGVDSSVAAALLEKRGFDVVGVHMRCYNVDGCAEQDAHDARRAAEVLGIPFYVFDFEDEYKEKVVEYMVRGYREGITPNPDVMCNKEIKFGLFLKKALEMGADYVATGHYVRRRYSPTRTGGSSAPAAEARLRSRSDGSLRQLADRNQAHRSSDGFSTENTGSSLVSGNKVFSLFMAKDGNKDQSYFLWTLMQEQLRYCLFPIGEYIKPKVRELARKFGLPNADKKDSQGICFLGKVTLQDFLKEYIPEKRGLVFTTTGEQIGEHAGVHYYTIGQRHIGVANSKSQIANRVDANPKPVYVAEKDVKTNTLVVAEGNDSPALYRKEIELTNVNFIDPQHSNILQNVGISGMEVYARVRYRQPLAKATLVISNSQLVNGNTNRKNQLPVTNYQLLFDTPIKFVAPGQSAVFYSKNGEMLGGGIIV